MILVLRAHEQQSRGRGDPRRPPGIVNRPVTNISALEPLRAFGSGGGPGH